MPRSIYGVAYAIGFLGILVRIRCSGSGAITQIEIRDGVVPAEEVGDHALMADIGSVDRGFKGQGEDSVVVAVGA